eukprot:TRINITY_DN8762_c0_g1_i2.p1 TRINITY_DN8762_c0_g1~~TRINITY_DN8762_c0_g1_i2.p1  ORF type:complete len:939 (+),score=307.98 TRINITY_DN8762_c0_g1_i2:181-2997(+)
MSRRVGPAPVRNWDDISTLHTASRRTATYGEMSQRYGSDTAVKRATHQTNGHSAINYDDRGSSSVREAWNNSFSASHKTVIRDHDGSSAIRRCEEYQEYLSERMQQADSAAKAMRNAQETINAETMLAAAKAEAEAWKHDKSKLASFKAAQNLSPLGVRTIIAERDALRYQLRKAAAELHKIEASSGGQLIELPNLCLNDMDRISSIKAQVVLELDQAQIRIRELESTVEELKGQRRHHDYQLGTYEEQLAERSETILRLQAELEETRRDLTESRRQLEEDYEGQLNNQRERFQRQADDSRESALRQLESAMRDERARDLEAQREQLESRYQAILDEQLAHQRNELLKEQADRYTDELTRLQSELHHREAANLEQLRSDLTAEKERAVTAARRQAAALQTRYETELEHQRSALDAEHARQLEELRREITMSMEGELKKALRKQADELAEEHKADMNKLRRQTEQQAKTRADVTHQRQADAQHKKLVEQHKRQLSQALNNLRRELKEEHQLELKQLRQSIGMKKDREYEARLKKELEQERKRATQDAHRAKASYVESAVHDVRSEKVKAVEALRKKMERQHAAEMETLQQKLQDARARVQELSAQGTAANGNGHLRDVEAKRSHQALKEELRQLHSAMKAAIAPRAEVFIDQAQSTSSQGMRRILTLVEALGRDEPIQPDPSLCALHAPGQTVDTLFACSHELTEFLTTTCRDLEAAQVALHREKKLVRHQVEDEMREERQAELAALRHELERERESEVRQRVQAAHHMYDAELARERREMELQLKEVQTQAAAQQRQTTRVLKERMTVKEEALTQREQADLMQTKRVASELEQRERDVFALERDLKQTHDMLTKAQAENTKLRQEIKTQAIALRDKGGPSPTPMLMELGVTRSSSSMSMADPNAAARIAQLEAEKRQQERERLRLERTISHGFRNLEK